MPMHPFVRSTALAAPVALASLIPAALAQPPRLIALSGSLTLGAPNILPVSPFSIQSTSPSPVISDTGVVSFVADAGLTGRAQWINRGASNDLVYTLNAPVLEMPGWVYAGDPNSPGLFYLGPQGQSLIVERIDSPALASTDALVLNAGDGPQVIATKGAVAAGIPANLGTPYHFMTFDSVRARGGQTVFGATLLEGTRPAGIWSAENGLVQNVVYGGQLIGSTTDLYRSPALVGIDDQRTIAFNALTGPFIAQTQNLLDSVWTTRAGGTPTLIVQQGQPAPGASPGTTFGRITPGTAQITQAVAQSRTGALAIYGQLSGPQVSITNDTGLWRSIQGQVSLVAREGDPAPGGAPGETFGSIPPAANINAQGHIAFLAPVLGPGGASANAIFSDINGALNLEARPGDTAPGTPAGTVFQSISNVTLSDRDSLVFWAQLPSGQTGVWASTPGNAPMPIALPGQQLEFGGSTFTIRSVDRPTSLDGTRVNANDELSLRLFLTTNQVAIVTFTVPAPSAGAALALLAFATRARRRAPQPPA